MEVMQEEEIKNIFKKLKIESDKKREEFLKSLTFKSRCNHHEESKSRFTTGTKK